MSKLLINEPPLQVLPSLAVVIGLNEAIALQQVHYLTGQPKMGIEKEGFRWVFYTYDEWKAEHFKFWSVPTIQRIFSELEKKELIISAQFDKQSYDRRKYYRVNYQALDMLEHINLIPSEHITLIPSLIGNTETTTKNKDMLDGILEAEKQAHPEKAAQIAFEEALGFGSLPWDTRREWQKFSKWVTKIHQADPQIWKAYAAWRKGDGKYQAMSNNKIRQDVQAFVDTGYPTFMAHSEMKKTDEEKPKYQIEDWKKEISLE